MAKIVKKVTIKAIENVIKEQLENLVDGEEDNYKRLRYKGKVKIDESVYEFSFTYLSKYSYISENEEPKYIYELEECFVWLSLDDKFIAIKNSPNKVTNTLKKIFAKAYNANINNVKLTKTLVKKIFNESNIKKGTFYKPSAGKDEAQKITIADPKLHEKDAVKNSLQDYDITASFYNEEIEENLSSTLGINCNQGKIYLTKNMNATVFRSWSVRRIKDIINYLKQSESIIDFDIFRAKNIMDNEIWDGYTKNQKSIIEHIAYRIYLHKQCKNDVFNINIDIGEMNSVVRKYFYSKLSFNCDKCDELAIAFCYECGSSNISFTKSGHSLICSDCGDQQNNTFTVQCEEGHVNTFTSIQDLLILFPSYELLSKLSLVFYHNFGIEFNISRESFYIQGNNIIFLKQNYGKYLYPEDIKELQDVTSIAIHKDEYDKLISEYDKIKEKCKSADNYKCNRCLLSDNDICIMKLFSNYKGYRPSPHQSMEFGDVNFNVTIQGEEFELVGIAKSRIRKQEVLNLSDAASKDMLQQFLSKTHDRRAGIIAVICPMRFHDQLKQELIYISKLTGTKFTILDDEFMVRQLKYYSKIKNINIA